MFYASRLSKFQVQISLLSATAIAPPSPASIVRVRSVFRWNLSVSSPNLLLLLRIYFSKDKIFKRLVAFFHESDSDKDGFLTMHELTTTLRKYGYDGTDEEIMVGMCVHTIKRKWRINTRNTFIKALVYVFWKAWGYITALAHWLTHHLFFQCAKQKLLVTLFNFVLNIKKVHYKLSHVINYSTQKVHYKLSHVINYSNSAINFMSYVC